jgi:putative ABC transport system permease protein
MLRFRSLEILFQDLYYGLRMMRANPGFTIVSLLVMSLGIGANTAIFSVVNGVLLRPLPFEAPDRLLKIWETFPPNGVGTASVPNFRDWQRQNDVFESIAAYKSGNYNLHGRENPERVPVANVTINFFRVLGVSPHLGRAFLDGEDQPGNNRIVILSDRFWRRSFGADPGILNQTISLGGEKFVVVGVMPANFRFPYAGTAMWTPLTFTTEDLEDRGNHGLMALGRLKAEASFAKAREQMSLIARRLEQDHPAQQAGRGVKLISLEEEMVQDVRQALLMLLGAVGFVLLISCTNVASLFLVRATARRKETAIRAALGAGRWRLIRQFLTESLLLSVLGGALALIVAKWGLSLVLALAVGFLPRTSEVSIDGTVIAFTLLLSLLTGLVFGLVPAFQISTSNLLDTLKERGRSGDGSNRARLRNILVITEIASALALLIGAGLMIKSFVRLQQTDSGLRSDNVLTARLSLPESSYSTTTARANFYTSVLDRVASMPGVRAAGVINLLPLQQWGSNGSIEIGEKKTLPSGRPIIAEFRTTSPSYFRTLGVPLVNGRFFTAQDTEASGLVVIINQTLARLYMDNENPLGKRIRAMGDWRIVIGVVGDVKQGGLTRSVMPELYIPYTQSQSSQTLNMSFVAQATSNPTNLAPEIRNAVLAVDPALPIYDVKTMEAVIANSTLDRRLNLILLSIFAALALILAIVGIYGVMSYSVAQRTQEIGVRMALGARPLDILKLIIGEGAALTMIGVGVGLICAFGLTRLMSSLLYGVSANDPITFLLLSLLLIVVALFASYLPARRATRVDPTKAIRNE